MQTLRSAASRGHAEHGWLDTWHSFSFADYYDPQHMHFGHLRVLNDDRIAAAHGFGMHPHRDMEIITYMLSGQLQHRDSMGNGSIIRAGDALLLQEEEQLQLAHGQQADVLLFDLA